MTEAYGQRLGERFQVENAPAIVTRALRTADIAVTEIRCDSPLPEMCGPIQQEDAFLVGLHLRDFPNREYWEGGRRASVCDLQAGESCLHDLKRVPTALFDKPYHSLVFYLPRAALDAIVDEANAPRIRDLSYEPGAGVNDVTISGLGSLLLPALSHPDQANRLFVDHVLLAVGGEYRSDLWRHGADVAADPGRACAMAGATREVSLATFTIGALCFVAFLTKIRPVSIIAAPSSSEQVRVQ
jgi:AraC family transcriptional regulator